MAPLGEQSRTFLGGVNALTGERSRVEVSSILLTVSRVQTHLWTQEYAPPLSNRALFARDRFTCLYCGERFSSRDNVGAHHASPKPHPGHSPIAG